MSTFARSMPKTLTILVAVYLLIGAHQVYAVSTPIITNDGTGTLRDDFSGMVGFDVQVGPVRQWVTALGIWDNNTLDGLVMAHQVGLWDNSGALLASVTVPSGTGVTLVNEFRYVSLSVPIELAAGQTYRLGSQEFNLSGDAFHDIYSDPTYATEFIAKRGRYNIGGPFSRPLTDAGFDAPYLGPNALFSPVPEPNCAALLSIGMLLVGCLPRRMQKLQPRS